MTRAVLRYVSGGEIVEVGDVPPMTTLLDHLRLSRRRTGTKEGCGEGDCGACTVAVGRLEDGVVRYRPVNACIQLLGQIDGTDVVTIEDLAAGGALHPAQTAMLEHHGSQCGFCTPGIVMSLAVAADRDGLSSRAAIDDTLSGNLCRCTGYRPIVAAAEATPATPLARPDTAARLRELDDGRDLFIGTPATFFAAPASLSSLARLVAAHPDATIVSGATDVGLWITKRLADLPRIISLSRVPELRTIEETLAAVTLGATVTYENALAAMTRLAPDMGELWRRIGSRQVRASGTVGGNIANGSPIGDTPPALIALGATLTLQSGDTLRSLPLESYFIAYGQQDRRSGEFVRSVTIPRPRAQQHFKALKLSKRYDQDISAVMFAGLFDLDGDRIAAARIAFGGMAATPKRASRAEAALTGVALGDEAQWQAALDALGEDFTPLSDMRASNVYRLDGARALLTKALIELAGADTGSTRIWEAAHA